MKLNDIFEGMGPYAGLGGWASRKENPFDSDTRYFAQQAKKGIKKVGAGIKKFVNKARDTASLDTAKQNT